MSSKEELLKRLSDGVLDMEEEDVAEAAREYLESGYPALDGIMEGLIDGMNRAGQLFDEKDTCAFFHFLARMDKRFPTPFVQPL